MVKMVKTTGKNAVFVVGKLRSGKLCFAKKYFAERELTLKMLLGMPF